MGRPLMTPIEYLALRYPRTADTAAQILYCWSEFVALGALAQLLGFSQLAIDMARVAVSPTFILGIAIGGYVGLRIVRRFIR